jgi:hypothetical protein
MPALLPHFLKGLASRYRSLFRKDKMEKELADEQFHLDKEIAKNIGCCRSHQGGMSGHAKSSMG